MNSCSYPLLSPMTATMVYHTYFRISSLGISTANQPAHKRFYASINQTTPSQSKLPHIGKHKYTRPSYVLV